LKQATKFRQGLNYYVDGITQGDRIVLAQAITLIESTLPSDQQLAAQVIDHIIERTGNSVRIGISGPPGVGKSTFIETFGQLITGLGKKLAVLTIDPSSQRTKGSILGDKTRMEGLASDPNAFIRPSASADALGGVAHKTRESMLLCEAAGFDTILIETVGVGQSETAVKNMTDAFLLLMLAGSGDELQGIKKGIMEMADVMVITKADGDNEKRALDARTEFAHAIHLLFGHESEWIPKVLVASALNNSGIRETWDSLHEFISFIKTKGYFEETRKQQNIAHLHEHFDSLIRIELDQSLEFQQAKSALEKQVREKQLSPSHAARALFEAYHNFIGAKPPGNKILKDTV
jgi:LAO/AO transport system kinase